jgi:hypothetical protein
VSALLDAAATAEELASGGFYVQGLGPNEIEALRLLASHARAGASDAADGADIGTTYTMARFAAAVDEAHAALHEARAARQRVIWGPISFAQIALLVMGERIPGDDALDRVDEALHRVGAGMPRVACATPDPEAQKAAMELVEAYKRELPCGHKVEDLIGGSEPMTGRPLVAKCGACLVERRAKKT